MHTGFTVRKTVDKRWKDEVCPRSGAHVDPWRETRYHIVHTKISVLAKIEFSASVRECVRKRRKQRHFRDPG